jgi:hypothetical protein
MGSVYSATLIVRAGVHPLVEPIPRILNLHQVPDVARNGLFEDPFGAVANSDIMTEIQKIERATRVGTLLLLKTDRRFAACRAGRRA